MSNQAVFSRSYESVTSDESYVARVDTHMRSFYRTLLIGTAKCTKASPSTPQLRQQDTVWPFSHYLYPCILSWTKSYLQLMPYQDTGYYPG